MCHSRWILFKLAPLLFITYINDLLNFLSSCLIFLYADDTKCSKSVSSSLDCADLQNDLTTLSQWSSMSELCFNANKCWHLHSYNSVTSYTSNYQLNNLPISSADFFRDLGIIFSDDLSWNKHYKAILTRAYNQLNLIWRTFFSASSVRAKD